jgi:exonuclease III
VWCAETKGQFTFWDQLRPANRPHNKGVRLDYFLCSGDMYPGTAEGSTEGDEEQATGEGVAASAETALVPLPVKEERKVQVYDAYILHEDTVGYSDHCPIVLVLIV